MKSTKQFRFLLMATFDYVPESMLWLGNPDGWYSIKLYTFKNECNLNRKNVNSVHFLSNRTREHSLRMMESGITYRLLENVEVFWDNILFTSHTCYTKCIEVAWRMSGCSISTNSWNSVQKLTLHPNGVACPNLVLEIYALEINVDCCCHENKWVSVLFPI